MHPTIIVDGYRKSAAKAIESPGHISHKVRRNEKRELVRVAKTSIQTKLVSRESDLLTEIVVNAVMQIEEKTDSAWMVDIDNIKVEKKPGPSIQDTHIMEGIVLDKEVVHGGMPKKVQDAKIALISAAFEIEKKAI